MAELHQLQAWYDAKHPEGQRGPRHQEDEDYQWGRYQQEWDLPELHQEEVHNEAAVWVVSAQERTIQRSTLSAASDEVWEECWHTLGFRVRWAPLGKGADPWGRVIGLLKFFLGCCASCQHYDKNRTVNRNQRLVHTKDH